ncbi:hypothetical protein [Methylobrevis pamukkalensis]|uniref:Flagellar basal body rod protein FlgB n=1 Tax=Methylobrevis pamukkalensis TaxID=1439726 RepID=A0A1E3GYQ8_9HYPH|nr:Flagellar basal body rod protein FlgB [Methylobrevis pamukkalensis]
MALTDLPIFRAMREKMMFHEARQQVLAENVSNAETPGYTARDLDQPDFFRMVATSGQAGSGQATGAQVGVTPAVTAPGHIAIASLTAGSAYRQERVAGYEVRPTATASCSKSR